MYLKNIFKYIIHSLFHLSIFFYWIFYNYLQSMFTQIKMCYHSSMRLTEEQYEQIKECFPKHRRASKISNLDILNAIFYVLENGCKWRGLPKEYGNWHTVYVRMNRWAKSGVLQRVFYRLQKQGIIQVNIGILPLNSTGIPAPPYGHSAPAVIQKFIWLPYLIKMP